jgi:ATP-dependent helicase/nuclease subunit B
MKLATLPLHVPFLDALAARWLATHDDPSRGLILLPTRRAARGLAEAFLHAGGGRPMLLPRITALGGLDEAPLALAGALDLPPAVPKLLRLAVLSRIILAMPPEKGGVRTADRAWMLAEALAGLMDEAERAGVDLARGLSQAADGAYAEHWNVTLDFLQIVTRAWPDWLESQGLMNPAARQVALLRAQAAAWEAAPPEDPVWVAGTTGGIPAVARLLGVVARMERGQVVLPGLDLAMPDAAWEALEDSHPQAGLRALLSGLGATRGDVAAWGAAPDARVATLSAALLPAQALVAWRHGAVRSTAGLSRLAASDPQEEAVAIAMVLRAALETPGARAALVTPDRALAGRVAAELLRWGVVADDSAGEPLAATPQAVFLRLLASCVAEALAPVPLLALLKHPLAAAGLTPAACRAAARQLEVSSLRGPRPPPGIAGLRLAAREAGAAVADLLGRVEKGLAPLLRLQSAAGAVAPQAALAALIEAAEALAATGDESGTARLWGGEEGEALAVLLAEALPALADLPDQPHAVLPGLLDALLEGVAVHGRRALRGRTGAEHPRVFIWGLLEARLQSADLVVLGGLVEGVWPPATDPGPWMSRPMRARAGLPSPEERVGQAAHDFVAAACCAPEVVLSCPRRRDGAPAVPARWLVRLDAYLGPGHALTPHPAAAWAGRLDQPAGPARPVEPPRPCPPVARRPRRLSVTEIETWLADPYAIYARHVLRLVPLQPLEEETDAADYGSVVHDGLRRFLTECGARWPADAQERLRAGMERALKEALLRPALEQWWRPRLLRIADWVAETESVRRSERPPAAIAAEVMGEWPVIVGEGGFLLRGRADRIERRTDGSLAILDYKTGTLPSQRNVEAGFSPQLPLEAAMAEAGAFGADMRGVVSELTYWALTGGYEKGAALALFARDPQALPEAVAQAAGRLRDLVRAFDAPDRPYLAQPHPGRAPRFPKYAQLSRVAEWAAVGDDDAAGGEA